MVGEFLAVKRFADTPDADKISSDVRNMIMQISLPIGKGNVLMPTDAPSSMGFNLVQGSKMCIFLGPESKEEADKLFSGLSEGGKITMALQEMFWGGLYGDFTDKYGVKWILNYNLKNG